jgi:hypothetical protein
MCYFLPASRRLVGRGTVRRTVEGQWGADSPSTMLRMVSLPIRSADREEK